MDLKETLQKRREFETDLIVKALEDDAFKQELLDNPKAVLERESGQNIPEGLEVKIIEEEANTITLLLPKKYEAPQPTDELSDEALENVAGGGNVGVAVAAVSTTGAAVTSIC